MKEVIWLHIRTTNVAYQTSAPKMEHIVVRGEWSHRDVGYGAFDLSINSYKMRNQGIIDSLVHCRMNTSPEEKIHKLKLPGENRISDRCY